MMIKRKKDGRLYIPFDITPMSGSTFYGDEKIKFEREADFILTVDGEDRAQLLVHSYYDPWRAAWNQSIEHIDAYSINVPEKNEDRFIEMRMVLEDAPEFSVDWHKKNADVTDTGLLHYGNGDPESENYDSRADYYIQDNITEIRIPWQLLNFSDPSVGNVHDDYYKYYGVENQKINEIYLGMGGAVDKNRRITFFSYLLDPWNHEITFHERLKQSYYVVKACWNS